MPEIKEAEYYIVDFDRTLVDTDKLNEVFIEICEQYGVISRERLMKVDAEVKQNGDSFGMAKYVRDTMAEQDRDGEWGKLEKQYIHESRALNYLLPGAAELLEWLAAHGKRYGILTYGNPLWQRMKLTAAGFNHTHHIILEKKEKGRFISKWQRSDGLFKIPDALGRGTVDRIVMIDDKAVSFDSFPGNPSAGYWVLDSARELPSQQGVVGSNVIRCQNLAEVRSRLDVR